MANYRICGATRPQLVQFDIERPNVVAALKAFRAKEPNANIETINGREVVGFCENTGKPIFDGDKYETHEDGPMVLVKRAKRLSPVRVILLKS